jgi:hypothetical protein
LPGRVGRAVLTLLLTAAFITAATSSAPAEEVFTSQAAASNATDSTWIPAPPHRAAVCIVDTGTDTTPDTTNVIARFAMDDSDGSDISPIKHGTLMSTIASAPKNNFGMVGAAPSINVVSVRASRDGITFSGIDVQAAVQLCITKRNTYNIKVVSLSLGGDGSAITASNVQRTEFQDTIDSARRYGLNVVAAAGNSERGLVDWPAGYGAAFAVGAATADGARCRFASWGQAVDLWAPGCPLDVGHPDTTGAPAWANGSSEAAAFVAAVLTQIRGLDPGLGVDASERTLLAGSQRVEIGSFIDVGGAFQTAGLGSALGTGHWAIPSAAAVAPPESGAEPQPEQGAPSLHESSESNGATLQQQRPVVAGSPIAPVAQSPSRLPHPVVRITLRRRLLSLRLAHRPAGAEARVEIYGRHRGSPFPLIAKRARFRADTLRIRVSGTISQVSIGYRDPLGARGSSEVIVTHPRA